MIRFDQFKMYTQTTDSLRFTTGTPTNPFLLAYFGENSTFLEDYYKLNIRRFDVMNVVIPVTTFPRSRLYIGLKKKYRKINLLSYEVGTEPSGKNIFYDTSIFLTEIDKLWHPANYRMRAGMIVKSTLVKAFASYPSYRKVLLYCIDLEKPFPIRVDRKIYPILQMVKEGEIFFDSFLICLLGPKGTRYRLLMKDRQFDFNKFYNFLVTLKYQETEGEEGATEISAEPDVTEEEAEKVSIKTSEKIAPFIKPENSLKVKEAIKDYVMRSKEDFKKLEDEKIELKDLHRITATSILYKATGNIARAKTISNALSQKKEEDVTKTMKALDKHLSDQILVRQNPVNTSGIVATKIADIPKAVDNKNPTHLFQKRQIDFEINLEKDVNNSFKVLENKLTPLYVQQVTITPKIPRPGEIDPSDLSLVKVKLKDAYKRSHTVNIEVPRIDPRSGTFRLHGRKKCLINQLVQCPISFPERYDSRFESSFSQFHVYSKRTRKTNYLEIYTISNKIPLLAFLSYAFGFQETLDQYELSYRILEKDPKTEFSCKIGKKKYLQFEKVNTDLKQQLCISLIKAKLSSYEIEKEFLSKEYFASLLQQMTGRASTLYRLNLNIANVVDPVAKQVLINQHLPFELKTIIQYMAEKVVEGYTTERNDLTNARIRGSEILVHLIQKRLLAAYNEYQEQVLSGNKKSNFKVNATTVLSDFLRSEIVTDMEYANPVEEMATITRVSPVGKGIGGIPSKEAIKIKDRNIHPTFFGNIDPVDTPEGANVGVVQQLTINSIITSGRGLFSVKPLTDEEGAGILSTSASLTPFVNHNDGARMMMACNQSRQSLPLKTPDPPMVQTGYETLLTSVLSDNFIKKSPVDGKVLVVSRDYVSIVDRSGHRIAVDITPRHLHSGSGKDTLSVFIPKVKEGQVVRVGTIIAEGSCISSGSIATGRTLCVAFMPYKGYNFEDGIIINEKLIENDKLTSLHGIVVEQEVFEKDKVLDIVSIGARTTKGQQLIKKNVGELAELLGYDEEDDESYRDGKKSPGGVVVDIEVFCNINPDKLPLLKDLIQRTNKKYGNAGELFSKHGKKFEGALVKFKIEQELKISLGDKLCNRHGNKGIISLIEKDDLMPLTPWGERLDIILNPISILSRMNMGQIFELYCGLISKALALRVISANNKSAIIKIISEVYTTLDASKNQEYSKSYIKSLGDLNDSNFKLFYNQIKEMKFFPIVVPAFKSPKINQIKSAMKILNLQPGYQLHIPELGTKTIYNVPVGYLYIQKLEHLGEMKLVSRSTGQTVAKTMQPTAGKKREGGQRIGEGDTYSLISYNCLKTLDELFGPLSDDQITKDEMISEISRIGHTTHKAAKIFPTRDLLSSYFVSLMLEGQ